MLLEVCRQFMVTQLLRALFYADWWQFKIYGNTTLMLRLWLAMRWLGGWWMERKKYAWEFWCRLRNNLPIQIFPSKPHQKHIQTFPPTFKKTHTMGRNVNFFGPVNLKGVCDSPPPLPLPFHFHQTLSRTRHFNRGNYAYCSVIICNAITV